MKIFNLPNNLELNKEYEAPFKEFGLKCPFCNVELDTKDIISIGFYKCNALYNNHVFGILEIMMQIKFHLKIFLYQEYA